jgi:TPR repeat protein
MKKLFLLFIILLGFATAKAQVYDLFSTPKYLFLKYKDLLTYNKFELESLIKKAQDQDKDFPDNELLLKIGFVYLFNDGLKDDGKALSFLKKAASEKEIEANALLGIFYERSGSFSTAISYYKKGERLGCGVCMLKLGEIFENGSGIFKDEKKALELYQKALDRNIIAAYAKMGDLNFYGKIVEKNLETAGFLYGNLYPIIEEGEIKMNMALKIAIINDELVRKKQSALKPNEAEDETLKKLMQERAKYFLIASELGNSDSMLMLANFYINR